jgi:4-hydroxymandelate oxidase
MAHTDGELAVARAADAANTIMICSTLSNNPIEEVVACTKAPVWFQLYVYNNKSENIALIRRAKQAGCSALVITVDAPLLGQRERDVKNNFQLPPHLAISNLHADEHDSLPNRQGHSGVAHYFENLINKNLGWRDIDWFRQQADMPIYLKGILHPEDARLAVEHGVDGIIVSNHGGRQLDSSIASIDALPAIVDQVRGQLNIIVDGGIRRGTDVLKARALGADCVGIGRPIIWGLNHSGQEGVTAIFDILQRELDLAMALSGCSQIADITSDIIV